MCCLDTVLVMAPAGVSTVDRLIIITDMDGTLLDAGSYSFDAALPALGLIRKRNIPLVVCSSKTRAEIEYYREKLGNTDPFVSENGGAVFIPRGYFRRETLTPSYAAAQEQEKYTVIRLGARYADLRKALSELKDEGFGVRGFGDMTAEEITLTTGLPENEAVMAAQREFDEPFIFNGDNNVQEKLARAIREKGFNVTRGQFYHILGPSDKGKAVSILTEMYRRELGEVRTIGLGDSPNDLPMLRRVDQPVVVEKTGGGYDPCFAGEDFKRVKGVGPGGWNRAVIELFEGYE